MSTKKDIKEVFREYLPEMLEIIDEALDENEMSRKKTKKFYKMHLKSFILGLEDAIISLNKHN